MGKTQRQVVKIKESQMNISQTQYFASDKNHWSNLSSLHLGICQLLFRDQFDIFIQRTRDKKTHPMGPNPIGQHEAAILTLPVCFSFSGLIKQAGVRLLYTEGFHGCSYKRENRESGCRDVAAFPASWSSLLAASST